MLTMCRRFLFSVVAVVVAAAAWHAQAVEGFPFGMELMLDATPMPGSKRVPMLEIEDDGTATIDLWCSTIQARANVGEGVIAIVPGQVDGNAIQPQSCDADQEADDAALLAALAAATGWQRNGDVVELSGPTTLHYRLMTN